MWTVDIVGNVFVVDESLDGLRDRILLETLQLVRARAKTGPPQQVFDLGIDG